jgi:CRP/FNR family cyclic AMP-dependent transcriptional regulator
MDRLELLRQISIFEGLAEDDLQSLADHLVERRFRAGENVFSQGAPGNEMFIVGEGHVNIYLPGEASRRVSLKDVSKGEYFGELALFDEKPRSASALATTDAVLFELSQETLRAYLEARPRAALPILRTMAERLRETNVLLSERAARNAVRDVEQHLTFGQRFADKVAEMNGSWSFILALMLVTAVWIVVNTRYVLAHPFDEYPFVFFNLVLAILVALQGPLIVMSQNRQTVKDRAQADTDYLVNLKNEVNIETILRELAEFRAEAAQHLGTPGRAPGGPE